VPLELGVVPDRLGEPELGAAVVKSGRTTGVTRGLVRRVHTVVQLDYGGSVGSVDIGCFEIGPDPTHPAADDEISRGGDSGSMWLFPDAGEPTTVVAGLHLGGEAGASPDEHALACLPTSVFEKLEISLRPPAPEDVASSPATTPPSSASVSRLPSPARPHSATWPERWTATPSSSTCTSPCS
jgi:endonuclease G, mitochondrial